jgi:transcription-repair coupling factor (superfamily II helicase)
MEILIPDEYVTNITERLNLYKELDSIEDEGILMQFRSRLLDRFGPVPLQTDDLLQTIRLRKLAKSTGFEKLILRKGRMNAYFPSNPESPYYQSKTFASVLDYIKKTDSGMKLRQDGNKLYLLFREVETINQGLEKLNDLLNSLMPG